MTATHIDLLVHERLTRCERAGHMPVLECADRFAQDVDAVAHRVLAGPGAVTAPDRAGADKPPNPPQRPATWRCSKLDTRISAGSALVGRHLSETEER